MAQLMPLPLTVSCFSKIQIGFTFVVRLTLVVPEKGLLNCVCVSCVVCRVCVCVCVRKYLKRVKCIRRMCCISVLVCHWRDCGHEQSFQTLIEVQRHVYFHAFHTRLKSIGASLSSKNGLPICQFDSSNRNNLQELPDHLKCSWHGCEVCR